jgi:hypothetical protein
MSDYIQEIIESHNDCSLRRMKVSEIHNQIEFFGTCLYISHFQLSQNENEINDLFDDYTFLKDCGWCITLVKKSYNVYQLKIANYKYNICDKKLFLEKEINYRLIYDIVKKYMKKEKLQKILELNND